MSIEQVRTILQDLSLTSEQITLAEIQGVANQTWLCDDVVVRISKAPQYLTDLFTESVAAPAAYSAGIPSPEPLAFCLEGRGDIPPYSVYRRVHGTPLSLTTNLANPEQFFTEYGKALRLMRDRLTDIEDPLGYLDEPWPLNPDPLTEVGEFLNIAPTIKHLIEIGLIEGDQLAFVHQDLHADNVIVSLSGTPVFIDWGDGGYGDASTDFRFVPARFLSQVLEAYGMTNKPFLARVILHQFEQLAYAIKNQRSYGVFGDSQLSEILAAAQKFNVLGRSAGVSPA